VVVAIMGMLAGIAALSLRGLRSPALNSAANEVASALKLARQMAISSRKKTIVAFPIALNPLLTNNAFRSYAIFEEVGPGDFYEDGTINNDPDPVLIPRTDWRTLPEGIVFCNLVTSGYSSIAGDPFSDGFQIGVPTPRTVASQSGANGAEWRFFISYTNRAVVRRSNGSQEQISSLPFIGFFPSGRAYYSNGGGPGKNVALRLVSGFTQNNTQVAVTDINNYYYIESDPIVGRIRIRSANSYRN